MVDWISRLSIHGNLVMTLRLIERTIGSKRLCECNLEWRGTRKQSRCRRVIFHSIFPLVLRIPNLSEHKPQITVIGVSLQRRLQDGNRLFSLVLVHQQRCPKRRNWRRIRSDFPSPLQKLLGLGFFLLADQKLRAVEAALWSWSELHSAAIEPFGFAGVAGALMGTGGDSN